LSDPEDEFEETMVKARGVIEAIEAMKSIQSNELIDARTAADLRADDA
jgi:hypothetical protein